MDGNEVEFELGKIGYDSFYRMEKAAAGDGQCRRLRRKWGGGCGGRKGGRGGGIYIMKIWSKVGWERREENM